MWEGGKAPTEGGGATQDQARPVFAGTGLREKPKTTRKVGLVTRQIGLVTGRAGLTGQTRGVALRDQARSVMAGGRLLVKPERRQEGVGEASREALQRRETQAPRMDGCRGERPRPLVNVYEVSDLPVRTVIDLPVRVVIDLPGCGATDLPAFRNGEKAAVQ